MRAPGDILLISCYELGHQPLGLASPMGFLERAGFRPRGLDLGVERLDPTAVRRARFVGVSVPMHTALRLGVRVADEVRRLNPDAHLCFYGLYAPLHAAWLRRRGVSSILGGEYEAELVALVERVEAAGSGAKVTPPPEVTLARLHFAPPSRAGLPPLDRYARVVRPDGSEGIAGYTEASRGCKHRCRHCPLPAIYDGRFFVVPVEQVVADARRLVAAGATHLTLGDPDFLNGPRHAIAVARALHDALPELTFDVTAKVEHLLAHRALLPELARLGCLFVVSAVESLSDRVLSILDKGHTRADVAEAIAVTRAAGLALRPSLLPFTPWSTLEEYGELLDFVEAHGLVAAVDPVQLSIRLLVPPGSLLAEHGEFLPHRRSLDEAALTWRWEHPDPRMDALQRAVYAVVEQAAQRGAPPDETFDAVRALVAEAAGSSSARPAQRAERARVRGEGRSVPRLTEPWFC